VDQSVEDSKGGQNKMTYNKCNKHNYSEINIGYNGDYNDVSISEMTKAGNASIKGLITKCVAVKRRGCN